MANESAWNTGVELAQKNIAARRERKQALTDEERKLHVSDLYSKGDALSKLIPSLSGERRAQAMKSLTNVEEQIASVYHPSVNPGALQKDWHWLRGLFNRKKAAPALSNVQYDPATTPDLTLPAQEAQFPAGGAANTTSIGAPLTIPGSAVDVRPARAAMTPLQRQQMARHDQARAAAELDVAAGLSPEEEAQQESAKKLAYLRQAQKDYESVNPNATPEQKAQFFNDLVQVAYGITQKPSLKLYELPDKSKAWLDASRPDLIPPGSTAVAPGAAKVGLKFDTATGQVIDLAANKRYTQGDPNNPPEVAAMFQSQDTFTRKKEEFQEKLARERAEALGGGRPLSVLDTANGNAPDYKTYAEIRQEPGRYIPAGEGDKALTRENFIQDILGSSELTREAITNLKEDFPEDMKVKIALAMRADDPHAALDQLISSGALGSLSDDQWNFLVATRQLAEQAMAMRTTLGAGQGSDQVRAAIEATLPSLLTPDRAKALAQLDAFDKTLARLRRGIPKVKLRTDVGGGGAAGDDMITMKLPDGRTGTIHRSQKEQFIRDHKGAVEVTQ